MPRFAACSAARLASMSWRCASSTRRSSSAFSAALRLASCSAAANAEGHTLGVTAPHVPPEPGCISWLRPVTRPVRHRQGLLESHVNCLHGLSTVSLGPGRTSLPLLLCLEAGDAGPLVGGCSGRLEGCALGPPAHRAWVSPAREAPARARQGRSVRAHVGLPVVMSLSSWDLSFSPSPAYASIDAELGVPAVPTLGLVPRKSPPHLQVRVRLAVPRNLVVQLGLLARPLDQPLPSPPESDTRALQPVPAQRSGPHPKLLLQAGLQLAPVHLQPPCRPQASSTASRRQADVDIRARTAGLRGPEGSGSAGPASQPAIGGLGGLSTRGQPNIRGCPDGSSGGARLAGGGQRGALAVYNRAGGLRGGQQLGRAGRAGQGRRWLPRRAAWRHASLSAEHNENTACCACRGQARVLRAGASAALPVNAVAQQQGTGSAVGARMILRAFLRSPKPLARLSALSACALEAVSSPASGPACQAAAERREAWPGRVSDLAGQPGWQQTRVHAAVPQPKTHQYSLDIVTGDVRGAGTQARPACAPWAQAQPCG